MTDNSALSQKIAAGHGFIAALDQSGGSTPGALKSYGYKGDEWADDEAMYGLVHDMRVRIITSPAFNGDKVMGAILFEKTMDGEADGKPVPQALLDRGVVPFLKIDKGLEDEADGVKLMKPNPGLDALLERAKAKGIYGTKMRSVIDRASPSGIAAAVKQQFEVANQILDHGLMPIVEPEVSIKSADRAQSDDILLAEIAQGARRAARGAAGDAQALAAGEAEPVQAAGRPPQCAARSSRCRAASRATRPASSWRKNDGVVASFSRALLEGLRHDMSDEEFNATLGRSIDRIYEASVACADA